MVVLRVSDAPGLALPADPVRSSVFPIPSNRESREPSPDGLSEDAAAPGATATTAILLFLGRN
jgi:hypothetical protein